MKMKFLLLVLSFVCMLPAAFAGEPVSTYPANYSIEGGGTGVEGTYLIIVTAEGVKTAPSDDFLSKCAIHGVLFRGFSSKEFRQNQRALLGSPAVEQQHADYFQAFFEDGGAYRNYCNVVSGSRRVTKTGKKQYRVQATITVSKEMLLADMQKQGIVRGLNTGF